MTRSRDRGWLECGTGRRQSFPSHFDLGGVLCRQRARSNISEDGRREWETERKPVMISVKRCTYSMLHRAIKLVSTYFISPMVPFLKWPARSQSLQPRPERTYASLEPIYRFRLNGVSPHEMLDLGLETCRAVRGISRGRLAESLRAQGSGE